MSLNLWAQLLTAVRVFLILKGNLRSTSSIGRDPPGGGNRFSHPECARPVGCPTCLSGGQDAGGGLWTGGGETDRGATTQMPCDSARYLASLSCFLVSKAGASLLRVLGALHECVDLQNIQSGTVSCY